MQALAERLEVALGGGRLARVEPLQFSALKTVDPSPDSLVGRPVDHLGRRGKFLVFDFGGPRLLVHLSQGGRVDLEDPPKRTRPRQAVVRLHFDERPAVLVKEFGTERKAGWWVVAPGDEGPLEGLGPEPSDPAFSEFVRHGDDRRRLHSMLRDQRTVAGIGRGNTDDILHRARVSPFATLGGLGAEERERLLDAVADVLAEALEGERAREGGLPTSLGDRFQVHRRHGEPCPRCGGVLQRVSYESYELVYCPPCQTGGKVLADRRMSRLLR
jgi:formamidopyrimidine-DNA glycosylase